MTANAIDLITFAKTARPDLNDNQIRFLKRTQNEQRVFEVWPRRSGKSVVGNLLLLHKLIEGQEQVAFIGSKNAMVWHECESIIKSHQELLPDVKIERKSRGEFIIKERQHLFGWTYDSLAQGKLRGRTALDHIHMDEYKLNVPRNFRDEWESVIKYKGDRITGLSTRV